AEGARWREAYDSFRARLPSTEPEWLRTLRSQAIAAFEEVGFPTTRHEDWRHTNVAAIARARFAEAAPGARPDAAVLATFGYGRAFAGQQLVFVDGRYAPELSSTAAADGAERSAALQIRSLRDVIDGQPELVRPYLDAQAA